MRFDGGIIGRHPAQINLRGDLESARRIIAAARQEKSILELPVYDGSEKGDKVFNTLSVIGRAIAPSGRVPTDAAAGKGLAGRNRSRFASLPAVGPRFCRRQLAGPAQHAGAPHGE